MQHDYALELMRQTQSQFAEGVDGAYIEILIELENMPLKWQENTDTVYLTKYALCCDCNNNEDFLLERFDTLLDKTSQNEKRAEAISHGLVHISPQTSRIDVLKSIIVRLEKLNSEYPCNEAIASDYAEGLFYLAEQFELNQLTDDRKKVIAKLDSLKKRYRLFM